MSRAGFAGVLGCALLLTNAGALLAAPLGTAFTYQGRLKQNGGQVSADCKFSFTLWDAPTGGNQIGSTLIFDGQPGNGAKITVNDGLFTVSLDFGVIAFTGDRRWVEVGVTCLPVGLPIPLSPRQEITATPYALYALNSAGGGGGGFWEANGNNIQNTNSGRVGIGTNAPAAALHVEGPDNAPLILARNGWYAIRGTHDTTSGSFPGVWGDTNSNSSNANGVRGVVNSTSPGSNSAGVRGTNNGTNNNGAGVHGSHAGGGVGVLGESVNGPGLVAATSDDRMEIKGNAINGFVDGFLDVMRINNESNAFLSINAGGGNVGIGGGAAGLPVVRLQVDGGTDAKFDDPTGGYFMIGAGNGPNLVMDNNEIMARNDGARSTLYLNNDGGDVSVAGSVIMGYEIVTGGPCATCPSGKVVIGGGCRIVGDAEVRQSYPASSTQWCCEAGDVSGFISMTAYAICARMK